MNKKVLIADDELLIRWALSDALSQDGYEVKAVEDGEKALEAIKTETFDFVITDLMMPVLDGWKVLRHVKENFPEAKVIILTGHGEEDAEIKAKERGAYAFVMKPHFLDEIRSLLNNSSPVSDGAGDEKHPIAPRTR